MSIHVYGGDIGAIQPLIFDPATGPPGIRLRLRDEATPPVARRESGLRR